jgi:predicted transcriptional regulator
MADQRDELLPLTSTIVSAFVENNPVGAAELPRLIRTAYDALVSTATEGSVPTSEFVAAVSVRKSLASREHIISMIDGKPYRTLKRHLTRHGLTFEQYKARYNLPRSYPSVAAGYSERRSAMAVERGLGRKVSAVATPARVKLSPNWDADKKP